MHGSNKELEDEIKVILPEGYDTLLCKAEGDDKGMTLKFCVRAMTEQQCLDWVDDFESSSLCTFNKQRTKRYPKGKRVHFYQKRYCHLGGTSIATKIKSKKIGCTAAMKIKLLSPKDNNDYQQIQTGISSSKSGPC